MAALGHKQHRKIDYFLRSLFSGKGLEPLTIEAAQKLGLQYLDRELRLSAGQTLMLTDQGLSSFLEIEQVLQSSQFPYAEPSDISIVLKDVLIALLSDGLMPHNSYELIALLEKRFDQIRQCHWFVVPVNGVELSDVNAVQLGDLKLVKPSVEILKGLGAKLDDKLDSIAQLGTGPCLVGNIYGTETYAKREFRFRAESAIGVVAAVAAMSYKAGATPFRVTLEMSPEGARSAARYVSWQEDKPDVTHIYGWGQHQALPIGQEMTDYLQTAPYIQHALALAQRSDLSILEKAIMRGLFWYSDAQRDTVMVMQLVKYWSCAEVIFSGNGQAITKTVSEGVATVLVCGGFNFKPVEEYGNVVRQLTAMYAKRSKAVHGAQHDHVTTTDIATLSQWTAYMLLGVLALAMERGYKAPDEIKVQTQRLAAVLSPSDGS
jgi:hypothetical protein